MLSLIGHCLPSLTNSLHAHFMISRDAREKIINEYVPVSKRSGDLLDCVEERIKAVPLDFVKFVHLLEESDPYLEPLVNQLVHSYCKYCTRQMKLPQHY